MPRPLLLEFLESRRLLTSTGGLLDPSFNGTGLNFNGSNPAVSHIAITSDGHIVTVGNLDSNDGLMAEYNTDGTLNPAFSINGRNQFSLGTVGSVRDVAIQPGDKILVAGAFFGKSTLVRFNSNGFADNTFGSGYTSITNVDGEADKIAFQSDGSIIVGGDDGAGDIIVQKFSADGILDTTFGVNGTLTIGSGSDTFGSIAVEADDSILVAGSTQIMENGFLVHVTRTGAIDSGASFAPFFNDGENQYNAILLQNGRIVVAGRDQGGSFVGRLNANGTLDTTFGTTGIVIPIPFGNLFDVKLASDGNLLAAGYSVDQNNGQYQLALTRLSANGTVDGNFGDNGVALAPDSNDTQANSVFESPTHDSVIIAGGSPTINDQELARFTYVASTPPAISAPTARVSHLSVLHHGRHSFVVTVTYRSAAGQLIDRSTLGLSNVTISGSHGSVIHPTGMIVGRQRTGGPLRVIYNFDPLPARQFVDGGAYGLILGASQVADLDGTFADAGVLGTFVVNFG